ncbi:S8 family serine peptidase [Dactylosporangium sp. CA-139066]|uniref:S8 family serine peptidase n=1 Tax=Dactylosporangium sp. CA-139066 TaxID=3239930 RepID=UPI003D9143D4
MVRRLCAGVLAAVVVLLLTARPAAADKVRDQEWHLAALGIRQAQGISQGDGVVVAVLDTGVDAQHAELSGAVLPGRGFGEGNTTDGRTDSVGHGTAMAGLIAGRGLPNGGGVLGVAPKAMILPGQVLRGESKSAGTGISDGIDWAVEHGAKVINLSLDVGEDPQIRQAVERALQADVVVVAGVGNTTDRSGVAFPASVPGVVAVGGTDRNGDHASVSVTGPEMVIAAPAVDVVSTRPQGKYGVGYGTSDATAIVAGVVALVRAKYPNLSGPEVVHRVTATATDKGKPGRDDEYGFGIVNPVAALTADVPPATESSAAPAVTAAPSGAAGGGGSSGTPVKVGAIAAGGAALVLVVGLVLWRTARGRR